ncbi:2-hydroxyacid dehydrogenase [Thiohalorhabdus methylotrophus]|uniref:2-hydroxyacid dehydrogenase n=1 Tax=Thiohalorhabdus methylotrophus TaxID=3242694 RepID=A0ABV4TV36_9GAMM
MRAVFLDTDSLDPGDLDRRALEACSADWTFFGETRPDQVPERIAGAEVVVTNKVPLDARVLRNAGGLRLVCIAATGTNNVDLAAARERDVAVANVVRYATPSVVQHVFSLMLALTTRLSDYEQSVRSGRWAESPHFCLLDFPIRELAGRTLGVVGHGELGSNVAHVAEAFGMRVRVAQIPGRPDRPERVALGRLLPEVDVLTLHCPLTPETEGLLGAGELERLPDHALLINTARGGIVDEPALAEALRAGRLGGAGVDVLTREPPPPDHPLLAPDIPNLILTPHVAWASREARQRMVEELAANIEAFGRGESRNRVA